MKWIFIYVSLLFGVHDDLNSQQMNLNDKGVGNIKIGQTVIGIPGVKTLTDYQYFNKFDTPEGGYGPYHYYYYEDSLLVLDNLGRVPKFFIATNEKDVIVEMEMQLDSSDANINDRFIEILGKPNLLSNSSIGGVSTNSKIYWHIEGVSIFLTTYAGKQIKKILFSGLDPDEPRGAIRLWDTSFFHINFQKGAGSIPFPFSYNLISKYTGQ